MNNRVSFISVQPKPMDIGANEAQYDDDHHATAPKPRKRQVFLDTKPSVDMGDPRHNYHHFHPHADDDRVIAPAHGSATKLFSNAPLIDDEWAFKEVCGGDSKEKIY